MRKVLRKLIGLQGCSYCKFETTRFAEAGRLTGLQGCSYCKEEKPNNVESGKPVFLYPVSRDYDSVIEDYRSIDRREHSEIIPAANLQRRSELEFREVWKTSLIRLSVRKQPKKAKRSLKFALNWCGIVTILAAILTMCPIQAACSMLNRKFPENYFADFIKPKTGSQTPSEGFEEQTGFRGEDPNSMVRFYKLYNRCSGGYLQMFYDVINAKGRYDSPLVDLRVQPDFFGSQIRIMSHKFGKYLCFNKRKRITTRYNGRSRRCVFSERMSENHFTEFESVWAPGTFLGFNRRGRFLNPAKYFSKRHCFQYMKIELKEHQLEAQHSKLTVKMHAALNSHRQKSIGNLKTELHSDFGGTLNSTSSNPAKVTLAAQESGKNLQATNRSSVSGNSGNMDFAPGAQTMINCETSDSTPCARQTALDRAKETVAKMFSIKGKTKKGEDESKELQIFVSSRKRRRHRLRHHGKQRHNF